jgi:hypothetical protein
VDPRAGLDDMEKGKFLTLPGLELRPVGRPARSQLLYRLHYPGSRRQKPLVNIFESTSTRSSGITRPLILCLCKKVTAFLQSRSYRPYLKKTSDPSVSSGPWFV